MRKARQKQLVRVCGLVAVLAFFLYVARVVLLPIALAAVFCYLVLPIARFLEARNCPKGIAAGAALGALFLSAAGLIAWALPKIGRDMRVIGGLSPKAGLLIDEVSRGWQSMLSEAKFGGVWQLWAQEIGASLRELMSRALEEGIARLPELVGGLSLLIFTPIFAFYLLRDREQLFGLVPRGFRPLAADLNHILQAFVRGYLSVAAVVGGLFGLLLFIFGIDYFYTLGLIMLIAELVPYLGPFIAFFPCVALGAVQGGEALIKLLLIWAAVQQAENLLITPHIMAGAMRLPPFYIMLAVLIGGFWWGVLGMIFAVPLAAAIRVVANAVQQWWEIGEEMAAEQWIS